MTEKRRKTFTLDPANAELCDDHHNASALVNDLLTQYREGNDKDTVAIDLQIQQKKRELKEKNRQAERVESELTELQQLRDGMQDQAAAELREAREALEHTPKDPTNPAIQKWANDLDMTPPELVERLDSHNTVTQ